METRANYLLIGAFTLLALIGTLGFFVWLASVQIDRQYETYGVLFEDVSGLDPSGDVLFNGISVGKVIGLRIYEEDPSKVFATIEIDSATPISSGTVAQLQSQGVTGVAYISLAGGTPGALPLTAVDGALPIITSRRSTVQTLVQDAPDLLAEATDLLEQFKAITGPQNQEYVSNILRNLDATSGNLDQALNDFSQITETVSDATAQITVFTDRLDDIGAAAVTTLERADAALISAQEAFAAADTALTSSVAPIETAERVVTGVEDLMEDQIPEILRQVSETLAQTNTAIADLQTRSGNALDGYAQTADLLNARLAELEQTMQGANTAFTAVTDASTSFDRLVEGDGTLLVAEARVVLEEARSAISVIETVVQEDVPAVVSDIRTAVSKASTAVDTVAADLTSFTGQLDPMAGEAQDALASATALLERAQASLELFDKTLEGSQGALSSAETAFDGATRFMNTDLGPILSDLSTASERISIAVEDVSADVPAITSDLRDLISRADNVVIDIQQTVAAGAPGIRDFTSSGLPELTRLSAEARGLVATLNSLVRRIERDPTRFFLNDRVPEYRR